jgi:hypothetical protein
MESISLLENGEVPEEGVENGNANAKVAFSITGSVPTEHNTNANATANANGSKGKLEPMEIAPAATSEDEDEDEDDMESLLPSSGDRQQPKHLEKATNTYLNGWIRPQPIGNMHILFPEYFHSSGWGILGPHWYGPACVWLLLVVATHVYVRIAQSLGPGSVVLTLCFFAATTFLLTDVSLRDPGVCLDTEIPGTITPSEAGQWRWCDFCHVYQPPDGAHCPDCNVCVAGYDHHCVWMGTCIGRGNYRQFVKFNISWLYYVVYAVVWLLALGPIMKGGGGH